jgi:hypothetical protein
MTTQELVKAVRAYALAHYEEGGWDILVECYEDANIEEIIGDVSTEAEAIARLARVLRTSDDYRQDIMATVF